MRNVKILLALTFIWSWIISSAQILTSEVQVENTGDLTTITGDLVTDGDVTAKGYVGSNHRSFAPLYTANFYDYAVAFRGYDKHIQQNIGTINLYSTVWGNGSPDVASGSMNLVGYQAVTIGAYNNMSAYFRSSDGYVGIGTARPTERLHVNGNIRALAPVWSDFVFEESYQLPSLEQVERHINEHGHLADIPSAEEVAENGINLGEMDARLLQKIEELTLYLLEQDKRIKAQQKEIDALKKHLDEY